MKKEINKFLYFYRFLATGSINFDKRSQLMAFTIIIVGLLGTFFLAYLDKDIASIITGLGTIALIFKGVFSKNNNGK